MYEWKFEATIYRKSSGEILLSKICDTYEEAQRFIEKNIIRYIDKEYPPTGHINKDYIQVD